MTSAHLYAASRTPFGRFGGALSGVRPDDLAATALSGVLAKAPGLDPAEIADVFWGNANGAGEDNRNVGRMAVLLAGLPTSVPATTVNRLCGSSLEEIAAGVKHGRLVVLDDVAHLAPAERPDEVARLIREHVTGEPSSEPSPTVAEVQEAGMAVRREVLGDAHVDRAIASTSDFTADFQDFITQYAWGSVWTRPGLDRRSRSLITLTALVARGHHEELAMHLRAARTNGLTNDEIKELLLQTAIYCGVPEANTAFRIAQDVLAEIDQEPR